MRCPGEPAFARNFEFPIISLIGTQRSYSSLCACFLACATETGQNVSSKCRRIRAVTFTIRIVLPRGFYLGGTKARIKPFHFFIQSSKFMAKLNEKNDQFESSLVETMCLYDP